jgi:hypothetical protein
MDASNAKSETNNSETPFTTAAPKTLYRVNVGGETIASTDPSQPDWSADTGASPSPYLVAGGDKTYRAGSAHSGSIDLSDSSLPSDIPAGVFQTERWDPKAGSEMTWAFPLSQEDEEVEVRLYFAEIYGGVTGPKQRVFDVAVEGSVPTVFDDIDLFASSGKKGALMLSHKLKVTDGELNLRFLHDIENPALKGIEIIDLGDDNHKSVTNTDKSVTNTEKSVTKNSETPSTSKANPQVINLDLPAQSEGRGGLITADVNNDNQKDFILTRPDRIAVYSHSGEQLWTRKIDLQLTGQAESEGLPGLHAPGVQVADVDGDQEGEILYLTRDSKLGILQGSDGETQQEIALKVPSGAEGWEHLVIANFRGQGDHDLLLQATNAQGYRLGRYLAAYSIKDLLQADSPQPLWTRDDFLPAAHSGAKVADLDGDGRDEVLGGTLISPQGKVLVRLPLQLQQRPHLDSIFVADVRPDLPGLEVVALEEGTNPSNGKGNRIFLYNRDRLIWETDYKNQEPQNAAVGDFAPDRPGLEIWSRSRYNTGQKPFVFDARGQRIAEYEMGKVAPKGWTDKGVEVIFTIDWTGEPRQLAAAKERHESGDVAIFDPISGEFIHRFPEEADRLYVADVSGDWREELVVLKGNQLRIYRNSDPNPNPNRPRLWTQEHYRRNKMTWNYYNP